jgi:hypothetical protein
LKFWRSSKIPFPFAAKMNPTAIKIYSARLPQVISKQPTLTSLNTRVLRGTSAPDSTPCTMLSAYFCGVSLSAGKNNISPVAPQGGGVVICLLSLEAI